MTTTEKNAAIARWRGVCQIRLTPDNIKYHSDWNWIMGCISKIEQLGYHVDIFQKAVSIHLDNGEPIIDLSGNNYTTKIEALHEAVYQFVVWHNQQVKENPKP